MNGANSGFDDIAIPLNNASDVAVVNGISPTGAGGISIVVTAPTAGSSSAGGFNMMSFSSVPEPVNVALGIFGGLLGLVAVGRHWKARRTPFAHAQEGR